MKKYRLLKSAYETLEKDYMTLKASHSDMKYQLDQVCQSADLAENQVLEIRELHQNARKLKHDMKNHLMIIASYLSAANYESAKDYTSEVLGKLSTVHSYIETGNDLMNHILNEKMTYAKSHDIIVKAEIENLQFAKLKQIDFSAILTNLLDNAIEASLGQSTPEIIIRIVKRKGYDTIQVRNKIEFSVLKQNPELESTKERSQLHGIGLSQVKDLVSACEGWIDFYEEASFFCVGVFIPE